MPILQPDDDWEGRYEPLTNFVGGKVEITSTIWPVVVQIWRGSHGSEPEHLFDKAGWLAPGTYLSGGVASIQPTLVEGVIGLKYNSDMVMVILDGEEIKGELLIAGHEIGPNNYLGGQDP